MDPTLAAFLQSWPFDPWVLVPLLVTAGCYFRGWFLLSRRAPHRWHSRQLYCFLGGLFALFAALASPIEPFAGLLLRVHMLQHLLLMMVAPPLLWLGAPLVPLLRGLPGPVRQVWIGPLFRSRWLRGLFAFLTRLPVALLLYAIATWLWHVPQLYDLALRSSGWHYVEHICFLLAALLFWYPVVQPYPGRARGSRWLIVPYLLAADVQNTVLSAILCFSNRVLYRHYERVPPLWGLTPLEDQAAAGVLMWVPGSLAFLIPVVVIACRLLYGQPQAIIGRPSGVTGRIALPLAAEGGSKAESRKPKIVRRLRLALQLAALLVALAVIVDGLAGPPAGAMNLAGVLPWVHWRGLVVLGLLAAGNFFCMACPFMLPRTLARKVLPVGWTWPRWLRSKWLAIGLVIAFFWAYEVFALWDNPWLTAWIAIGYFVAALAIDGLFRGASFCKYVCPIGQFHFVQSLVSPLEVGVRDPAVCQRCQTHDCIRGRDGIPGCELHLYQPRKAGNMDCTFCLDCVAACPHGNVGLVPVAPGAGLIGDPARSGLGRFGRRPDIAALVLVLVFAAFANAAGMVAPVVEWQDSWTGRLGLTSPRWRMTAFLLGAMVGLPLLLATTAAVVSRRWSGDPGPGIEVATRFAFALVPLGFGMWLAHYSFHFLSAPGSIIPVVQRLAAEWGWTGLGSPAWVCACCVAVGGWLLRLEILFLDVGLLGSLYLAYRIARHRRPGLADALRAVTPWALLIVMLFAAGIWIVLQPMEMRGLVGG